MQGPRLRRPLAAGAALGIAGALGWAPPAAACSCGVLGVDEASAHGYAAAVVTNTSSKWKAGSYRVEAAYGAELPERVEANHDPYCGGPAPLPEHVAAVLLERKGDGWRILTCGYADLGDTMLHAAGEPRAVKGGRAVAVAAGSFGGSRLVALDRQGRAVAWDGQDGTGVQASVCPGGAVVIAYGHGGGTYGYADPASISVHDAESLRVQRSVPVPKEQASRIAALRCADPRGERVELLLCGGRDHERVTSYVVTGHQVRTTDLGRRGLLVAAPDGFVSASSRGLAWVGTDGTRRVIADEVWPTVSGAAVSLDGRRVTVHSGETVWTVDLASGRRLGQWRPGKSVAAVAFTGSGRVLVRLGDWTSADLRSFTRSMRPLGTGTAGPGARFAAVGESAVTYQNARLDVVRTGGGRLVVDELRLAGAQHLVPASDAGFVRGQDAAAPQEADDDETELRVALGDEDSGAAVEIGLLGGGAALLGALVFLARRHRGPGA